MKAKFIVPCSLILISSNGFSLGIKDFRGDCNSVQATYQGKGYRVETFDFINYMGTSQSAELRLSMDPLPCVYNQSSASFVIRKIAGARITTVVNVSIVNRSGGLVDVAVTNTTSDCIPVVSKNLIDGLISEGGPPNDTLAHQVNESVAKDFCPKFTKTVENSIIKTLSSKR